MTSETVFMTFQSITEEGNTMSDDKSKKGPQDRSRVNIHEEYEVKYWSERFGVSAAQLKAAVEKVGPSVTAVEAQLKNG